MKLILEADDYADIIKFINIYREIAVDGRTKNSHLAEFKKIGLNKDKFKRYLQQYREYFILDVSYDINYLKAYLKINRAKLEFRNSKWVGNRYVIINPTISDETKNNFNLAKEELYPNKTKKKAK